MFRSITSLVTCLQVLFAGWFFQAAAQQTVAEWNFPNNPDNAIVDIASPLNAGALISTNGGTGAVGYTNMGPTTYTAHCTNWDNGSGIKCWELTLNTTGFSNMSVSSKQYSSSAGPRDFKIQFRIGAGAWVDLIGATAIVVATNWTSGVVNQVPLPVACDNQASVSLRWIMTSNTAVGGAAILNTGNTRIDDINISWNADHYYRSAATGNWAVVSTWESSPDNITWNPAIMTPTFLSRTITIRNSHTVTVSANLKTDETVIENGGMLSWTSGVLNLNNGTGVDLQADGTINDVSPSNVLFNTSATWSMGAAGTFIKSSAGSANNWRDNYNGGISTIPATANWIVRKTSGASPSVSTINMFYPNLTIENNAGGMWLAAGSSGFQGAATNTTIKGNFDVGGAGINTVEFENISNNALATVVQGDLIVRPGNILRNYGTGFDIQGNLVCDGTINYDATDARRLIFSGTGAQSVSGSGALNVFNMIMNKPSGDLTLNRTVEVDNNITFNNPGGRIFTTPVNLLVIESAASATGANNTSFVHGPVRKLGDPAFTFPVGKNNDYQAIAVSAGVAAGGVFWTENFSTGCNQGLIATGYSGVNGSWGIVNTGLNETDANTWYVSAAENGNGAGACGSGCGSNRSLHVGSTVPVDPGAAYLETDPFTCSFLGICSATDKRTESPVIDCSGRTGITLAFNYMEAGDGINDNALLYYFDGTSWTLLADLPKTLCCGGVACNGSLQGIWTAYSIALPASANNNANVRIGFRWMNNADGIATDPSFAVDDISLSSAGAVESFTAEYFKANPQVMFSNVVNPNIDHISQCEYWMLTQDAGSSARTVTLAWDGNSCGVTLLPDLVVARYNGASWDDRGNGGTTGNTAAGTVTSAAAQTAYGPFTLASVSFQNPLPVELISLEADYIDDAVEVKWVTASEINSDYFTVLRSADGKVWEDLGSIQAAGFSSGVNHYRFADQNPLPDVSYYRLKQVDRDGSNELTRMVAVNAPHPDSELNLLYTHANSGTNSGTAVVYSSNQCSVKLEINDVDGKKIFEKNVYLVPGINAVGYDLGNASGGIYLIRLLSEQKVITGRFFH